MRRAVLVNGALLALALGTLAVVWSTRDSDTSSDLEARQGKLLASWHEHDIAVIRLQRGQQKLELARTKDGEFRIRRPWQERADVATVKALLGSLELASPLRPADGVSREAAGLVTPALQLSLEMHGKTRLLRLGGPAPAPPGARYLEVVEADAQSRIYTVSQGLVAELDLPWDKFRETRLLELGRDDLSKLTVETSAGRSELVRQRGTFMLAHGDGSSELADGEALDKLLTGLTRIVSEQFVEPDAARKALGTDSVRLRLEPTAKERPAVTLAVGSRCPSDSEQALVVREIAGGAARAGCIPHEVAEALRVTPAMLELSRPFSARVDEVEELELKQGARKLELTRKNGGFLLKLPTRGDVPLDAGNQRLRQLVASKGERVAKPDLAALGLAPAAGEAVIHLAGADAQQGRQERVQLGKPRPDGSRCLVREADRVVLCVPADVAKAFEPDATLLKSLELLSFGASQLSAFSVETPELRERIVRAQDGSFALEQPPGYQHDGGLVSDAVQTLGALRAERWVAAQPEPAHGLGAPRLRVGIELDGAARRELLVGAASEAGYFASLSPDPGVFVLPRSLVRELERPLLNRSLCPLPRTELQRIELHRGERQLALTRRGDTWEAAGSARASELGEALSALRADFTVRLGPARPSEGLAKPSLRIRFVDAKGATRQVLVGGRATLDDSNIAYARIDGVDATFALSATTLDALQDF